MVAYLLSNDKPSYSRLESFKVRLALALTAAIPLSLTFLVPIEWLNVFACPFLTLTGMPCPFCGFTRSIWAISAGDWLYATINCPLAWVVYIVLIVSIVAAIGNLLRGNKKTNPIILSLFRNQANHAVAIIISLVLLNWIYRLSLGLA